MLYKRAKTPRPVFVKWLNGHFRWSTRTGAAAPPAEACLLAGAVQGYRVGDYVAAYRDLLGKQMPVALERGIARVDNNNGGFKDLGPLLVAAKELGVSLTVLST